MTETFEMYFERKGHETASAVVRENYNNAQRLGMTIKETAKLELATALAMLSSSAYTTFWLLYHIYSDSTVLETVREELYRITALHHTANAKRATLSANKVKADCPTLVALLYETLRLHGNVMSLKHVDQEFMFLDKYRLKKDAYLMIPSQSLHMNKTTWGQDAGTFDHRRFTQRAGIKNSKNTGAFRPFGSGTSICPGRHFSTNVIVSLTAAIVSRYDLRCTWPLPGPGTWEPWNAMTRPDGEIVVQVRRNIIGGGVELSVAWDKA